jgi:hypothetical protein
MARMMSARRRRGFRGGHRHNAWNSLFRATWLMFFAVLAVTVALLITAFPQALRSAVAMGECHRYRSKTDAIVTRA